MTLAMIACELLYYEQSAATTRPTPSLRGGAADAAIQPTKIRRSRQNPGLPRPFGARSDEKLNRHAALAMTPCIKYCHTNRSTPGLPPRSTSTSSLLIQPLSVFLSRWQPPWYRQPRSKPDYARHKAA